MNRCCLLLQYCITTTNLQSLIHNFETFTKVLGSSRLTVFIKRFYGKTLTVYICTTALYIIYILIDIPAGVNLPNDKSDRVCTVLSVLLGHNKPTRG